MASINYVGNPDFRGWLAADPNRQWALNFVGNDYTAGQGNINMPELRQYSQGAMTSDQDEAGLLQGNINQILEWGQQYQTAIGGGGQTVGGATTGGAGGGAAAAEAAARAAKATKLRGNITDLVNGIKDIYNQRYGLVDKAAADQAGKLNERYGKETEEVTSQATNESNAAGGAFAARGTRDSSDYGNTVDDIKEGAAKQISDLGSELQENQGKIGSWAEGEKQSFDAQKGGLDTIVSRLQESTDPDELSSIRNSLDARITELRGGASAYNTNQENVSALERISPSNARAQQLKTTLSSILGSAADPGLKQTLAERLVSSANLSGEDAQRLLSGFSEDLTRQAEQ